MGNLKHIIAKLMLVIVLCCSCPTVFSAVAKQGNTPATGLLLLDGSDTESCVQSDQEPNNTLADAFDLGTVSDCEDALTLNGTFADNQDSDWYTIDDDVTVWIKVAGESDALCKDYSLDYQL